MSAALRIVERLAVVDHADESVVVFAAALLGPLFGRDVSVRRDSIGEAVAVSRPRSRTRSRV